jgi:predicted nucleic acid-binding protein
MAVVDRCAALRASSLNGAWGVGDNDLWIAATAQSRGCAVASCDTGFCRMAGIDLIYLPSKPDAPATCADVG